MPDLCDCFIFKPLWWKDYGIPLLEAVAIPLLVWFLTWYYGAEKAEKRKEKRELRDNLNMLLTVCLLSIMKAISYRKELIYINDIEKKKSNKKTEDILNEVSKIFCLSSDFNIINASKYAPCIEYDTNFIMKLVEAKNAMDLVVVKVEHRNNKLYHISKLDNDRTKDILTFDLINLDLFSYEENIKYVDKTIMTLFYLEKRTKDLENKIKGLKLDTTIYSEEQKQLFAELEQKYIKELKK